MTRNNVTPRGATGRGWLNLQGTDPKEPTAPVASTLTQVFTPARAREAPHD